MAKVWLKKMQSLGIQAVHVLCSQQGRAAAADRGRGGSEKRFVAVTDDDCFVDADWLENMDEASNRKSESNHYGTG